MALINCEECGKKVSDKAPICPSCGFPKTQHVYREAEHHWLELWVNGIFFSLFLVVISILMQGIWKLLPSICWKILFGSICLLLSLFGVRSIFLHHYNIKKKIDEKNGKKREII